VTGRQLTGVVLTIGGAAAVTGCLAALSSGMRDVMQTDGGFCASGGPNVIASQCSAGDIKMVTIGILGGLVAAAVYAAGTSLLGRSASTAALVAWAAMFSVLGWNFISLGLHPGPNQGASSGWLFTGGTFWLMALSGLIPLLGVLVGDVKRADRRYPAYFGLRPLVRTSILPGDLGWSAGTAGTAGSVGSAGTADTAGSVGSAGSAGAAGAWRLGPASSPGPGPDAPNLRSVTVRSIGVWLVASLAGLGLGLAATSAVIGTLR
jgi:hypothetical protein